MTQSYVKARCNLLAVLRGIEYLAEKDPECKSLISNTELAIQFIIKRGPAGNLAFSKGSATMKEGKHKSSITLYFTSPEHFNKMMDGEAQPIPLKGLTKISFLKGPFMKFADKLSYYLKPEKELLKDPLFFTINTELTAYTAFFALAEIGNYDPMGKLSAVRMPNGILQVQVDGGIGVYLTVNDGKITATKGYASEPRAILSFATLEDAHRVLNGETDTFTALGSGRMGMKGFIPMLDNMNPLLDLVPTYLG